MNGRHFKILFMITMQYALGIPPNLRTNIDYVFIFNEPSVKNRKKIYDDYAGMLPSFDHFCNILDACTQNHECLVIKTSGNSSDLRDQVFWYKAEYHNNFRTGHPKFWNFHSKNYNDNYEEDDDKDQEHLDKLKRKFAKTKKLKYGNQPYLVYDLYQKSLESNYYSIEYLVIQKTNNLKNKNLLNKDIEAINIIITTEYIKVIILFFFLLNLTKTLSSKSEMSLSPIT